MSFSGKNDAILLKNSAFRELQGLIELIFQFTFQFSILFILKESSKLCLIFSHFSAVFEKLANISTKKLSFNHILKECLISKDLQIISKKADTVLISDQILKRYCDGFGTWSSPSTTRYDHLTKQGSNFTSLVALIFPPEFGMLFDFAPA